MIAAASAAVSTGTSSASASKALWFLTRGTGVVSLALLTLSVVLGIVTAVRWEHRNWPRWIIEGLHRNISLLVVVFIGLHVATTVVDGFAPIGWLDAVVPFRSPYRPLWLGLGALSLDMLLAVALTSIVRAHLGYRLWRAVHWLAYACWPVALMHGLGTGSDARATWMLGVVAVSVAAVLAALAWRLGLAWPRQQPAGRWAAVGATVLLPLAIAAWALLGPLQPGWARIAGTPVALTSGAGPAARPGSTPTTGPGSAPPASGVPASGATGAAVPARAAGPAARAGQSLRPFSAPFAGTITESRSGEGQRRDDADDDGAAPAAVIDLSGTLSGAPLPALDIRLRGQPLATGGLALRSGDVTLGTPAVPAAWEGRITSLDGGRITATVTDGAGRSLDLTLAVTVDDAAGTVAGQLSAVPASGSSGATSGSPAP